MKNVKNLPEILIITSYPPCECGIATYSEDLIHVLNNKFTKSFDIKVCALETRYEKCKYPNEVSYVLETDNENSYLELAENIDRNVNISLVLVQHEFGLFRTNENNFIQLLQTINKPIIVVFHTVLPHPNAALQKIMRNINNNVNFFIVMTNNSSKILVEDYQINADKISVIPHGTHAVEVLKEGSGIIVDFENPQQLAEQVNNLLDDEELCNKISFKGIHKLAPTAWENSAISHAILFEKINKQLKFQYKIPEINLNHFKNLTTDFGMIQFSIINQPQISSGYTLDDNARALIAICQHFELKNNKEDMEYIYKYYNFIRYCLQTENYFLNYVDIHKKFTKQNSENLADSNGRAIWALGFLISIADKLPMELIIEAKETMQLALANVCKIHSPRAMAFIIKGIYYSNIKNDSEENILILKHLADKLVELYKQENDENWHWYESYLTYGNSILPEAMLCAYLVTKNKTYSEIAKNSFDFLLSKIFINDAIKVVSNKGWLHKRNKLTQEQIEGEQPIDVAYTIIALGKFYDFFEEEDYLQKLQNAFHWFLGKNDLHQIIYNPYTGGCYDGLENTYINLNQGAESTVSYLMARLTIEKYSIKMQKGTKSLNTNYSKIKNKKAIMEI